MRSALGFTVDSITAELNVRNAPAELTDTALERRNDLDTILDTAKEEQLELLSHVEDENKDGETEDHPEETEANTIDDADETPDKNTGM